MGVPLTLKDVQSGFLTAATFNSNNTLIEQALAKALNRTSNADDNAMEVDLDMGLNTVFNVRDALNVTEAVPYGQLQNIIQAASSGLIARLRETRKIATAGQTVFNLSDITYSPGVNNIQVYVNGVAQVAGIDYQETDTTTITFLSGLSAGDAVDVYVNDSTTNVEDAVLRSQLASDNPNEGASLVSMEGGPTVQVELSQATSDITERVIREPTLTELKARVPVNQEQVTLAGLRSGLFEFDSSDLSTEVANDPQEGVYVAPDSDPTGASGAWVRQYSGPVNIQWFGAIGDGVTDNTLYLQAAIDFGQPIFVPPGNFFSDTVTINSGMVLKGIRNYSKISHVTVASATELFNMDSNVGSVYVEGITFDGRQQSQPQSPTEIRIFSAGQNPNFAEYKFNNCRFENVHTKGILIQTDGIARSKLDVINCEFENIYENADSTWNPSFCTFSENIDFYASGNSFKAGYNFTQDGAMAIDHSSRLSASPVNEYARVRIIGNYFEKMGRSATVSGNVLGCIELRLWTEITVISNNNFFATTSSPIRGKTDCKEISVSGNTMRNCQGTGVEILRGVSTGPIIGRASITGNNISTQANNGISVFGATGDVSQDYSITGNVIANSGGLGIEVNYAENMTIVGNSVFNSALNGIDALECNYINISNNNVDASGDRSGIEAINCPYIICSNNVVNEADDVGIRIGGVTKAAVNGNAVMNRSNVGGNDVDYRLTTGTTLVTTGNVGTTISTFGFTTTVNANNEF